MNIPNNLKVLLDTYVKQVNAPNFIDNDPIQIPHRFTRLQDIEITAFWTAILAWGQRKTIINSANKLITLMDNAPYDFIINHTEKDVSPFLDFKHRTFNATDALYFLRFLQHYYKNNTSLQNAFARFITPYDLHVENALVGFQQLFFSMDDAPKRTQKHIATPARNSACKRLNMFLRWMVRQDEQGVDFGIWQKIKPSQLLCPLDVHVERIARRYGLITRKQRDWKTVLELTNNLRTLDANDPVKYDFALFGIGVLEKM